MRKLLTFALLPCSLAQLPLRGQARNWALNSRRRCGLPGAGTGEPRKRGTLRRCRSPIRSPTAQQLHRVQCAQGGGTSNLKQGGGYVPFRGLPNGPPPTPDCTLGRLESQDSEGTPCCQHLPALQGPAW